MPLFDSRIPEHRIETGHMEVLICGKPFYLGVAFHTDEKWVEALVIENHVFGPRVVLDPRTKKMMTQRFFIDFEVHDTETGAVLYTIKQ